MDQVAVRINNLSKLYYLGRMERYQTLRDTLADAVSGVFRFATNMKLASRNRVLDNSIWALKNVCVEIEHGEVVGIIGRNGAGKSTLLKILSRITEPTKGYAEIYGHVGSLLEVGTGFHPELTGRENIYLSGAILGMKKAEIQRKFDEIVAFAEIEKFLDTPVKHYSSGMYVRLAFAVAAHLEPDILLVDEVLAVGDAAFQKKCLGKMGDVAKQGRTVLFVSHNMPSVAMLCNRVLLFSAGELIEDGPSTKVVNSYLVGLSNGSTLEWADPQNAPGTNLMRLRSVRTLDYQDKERTSFGLDEDIFIELTYWLLRPGLKTHAGYHLYNSQGVLVFVSNDFHDPEWLDISKDPGIYRSLCRIPGAF
ncbi:partial Teichoic acids export ATP-binding protein TagH, partial [uncultured bacterium]